MRKIYLGLILSFGFLAGFGQSTGDIAFVGFNVDGDDDFAIVALADIPANTTIYFTDNRLLSPGVFNDAEGVLEWNTGSATIDAGSIVIFTDVEAVGLSSSVGSLIAVTDGFGSLGLSPGGDTVIAYLGDNASTPTTFLAGIMNEAGNEGDLTGSGLVPGSTFVEFFTSGNPDGGVYSGPRDTKTSFSEYLSLIGDPANWTIDDSDGETLLPFNTTAFTLAVAPIVGFDEPVSSVEETDATFEYLVPITLSNYGGTQVDLSIMVSGGTADPSDYTLNTTSLSFTSNGSMNVSIDINDDADDLLETVEITLTESTNTGILISPDVYLLTINDDDTAPLVITEIMYNPASELGSDNNFEYLEIYNAGSSTVDLDGYTLSIAIDGSFTSGDQIAANEYILVTIDAASYPSTGGQVFEWTSGALQNTGETIVLKNASGAIVDEVAYDPSVIKAADGDGPSLSLFDITADNNDMTNWVGSGTINGTPGLPNDDITVWTASSSTDIVNSSNWTNGVPDAGKSAAILSGGANPTLADDLSVASLKVGNAVSFTVNAGTLVINGEIILDGMVDVASGASLVILGEESGAGTLTVNRNTEGNDGYSIIGAPVSGASLDALDSQGANLIYDFDGTDWLPLTSGAMTPGKGYFMAQVGVVAPAVEMTGAVVAGNQTANVSGAGDRFTILANPYAAAISAADVIDSDLINQVTTGSIYIWDDGGSNNGADRTGTYRVVNNMGTSDFTDIGSVQGFFMQATDADGGAITFTPDMQVTTAGANVDGNFYRKGNEENQLLKLTISGQGLNHETVLGLLPEATLGRDYALDAQYLKGNDLISFYSMMEEAKFATQGLPSLIAEPLEVALGMDLAKAGSYTLKVAEFEGFHDGFVVTLLDLMTGQSYQLDEAFEMTFATGAVSNAKRFKIVFSNADILSVDDLKSKISVFGHGSSLTLQYASDNNEQVNIFTLDGRLVFNGEVNFSQNQAVIAPNLAEHQIYLLTIRDESIKFILQ